MTEQEYYRKYTLTEKGRYADVRLLADYPALMLAILERLQQVGETQTLTQVVEWLDRDMHPDVKALASMEELTAEAHLLALEREGYVLSEDDMTRPRERYIKMPEPRLLYSATADGKVAYLRGQEADITRSVLIALHSNDVASGFGLNRLRARIHVMTGVLHDRDDLRDTLTKMEQRGLVVTQPWKSRSEGYAVQESDPELHSWDIWAEGYSATGESGTAHKLNESPVMAASFDEAVAKFAKTQDDPSLFKMVGGVGWTYWGCNLFASEKFARLSFG